MVGLAGVMMIVAAFCESWRIPVLIYSAVEKALFVSLCVGGAGQAYAAGFLAAAAMDALVVLYVVAYFSSKASRQVAPAIARRDRPA